MNPPLTAFVLGAGLGTRLRPLTNDWPKPLLSIGGQPIISWIFDRLLNVGVSRIIVNTHHCPQRYREVFPEGQYRDVPLIFRHEPVLLETGGGIRNIVDLLDDDAPLLVHNGDILSTMPLKPLVDRHRSSGVEVTLAVRTDGAEKRIRARLSDSAGGLSVGDVADIRGELGVEGNDLIPCQFTGVYLIERRFIDRIPAEPAKVSVVPVWLDMLRADERIEVVCLDDGWWTDIGTLEEFHRMAAAVESGEVKLSGNDEPPPSN